MITVGLPVVLSCYDINVLTRVKHGQPCMYCCRLGPEVRPTLPCRLAVWPAAVCFGPWAAILNASSAVHAGSGAYAAMLQQQPFGSA